MATYAQTKAALADGLTGFTHLFNAMRQPESREPGPAVAALEAPGAWFGMIVDGHHVDPAMLRLALRGAARPMLVTDAMPTVGGSRSTFMLYGQEIGLRDGRCTRADGTLAGAHLDMASAVRNCIALLGVPLTQALRFASAEPANFLGLGGSLGRIAPGYRADLVAFDARLHANPQYMGGWCTWYGRECKKPIRAMRVRYEFAGAIPRGITTVAVCGNGWRHPVPCLVNTDHHIRCLDHGIGILARCEFQIIDCGIGD